MSLLNDFENSRFSTKTILLFYVLIMPLFFISIYLFKPEMIAIIQGNPLINLHFFFLVSVCLVLSTLWLSAVYMLSKHTMPHLQQLDDEKRRSIKHEMLQRSINKLKEGDTETKVNEITRQMTMILQEKLNKKYPQRVSRFTTNSTEHYRIMLIYSMMYLSIAIAINHLWLNWDLRHFIMSLPLFVVFRIILLKLRLQQKQKK